MGRPPARPRAAPAIGGFAGRSTPRTRCAIDTVHQWLLMLRRVGVAFEIARRGTGRSPMPAWSDPPGGRRSRSSGDLSRTDSAPGLRALAERFPPAFAWGAATAAYQVEGAVDVDGRTPSIWDTFSHTPGRIAQRRDRRRRLRPLPPVARRPRPHGRRWACVPIASASRGRGSSRAAPAPANAAGLDFYDRLVDGLLERGIEPWVTLYHWDLPQAIEDRGGWLEPEVVDRFGEYAGLVARRLGDRCTRLDHAQRAADASR